MVPKGERAHRAGGMLLYQKERQREQAAPSTPTVSFGGAHSEAAAAAFF